MVVKDLSYNNVPGIIRRQRIPMIMLLVPFSGYLPCRMLKT